MISEQSTLPFCFPHVLFRSSCFLQRCQCCLAHASPLGISDVDVIVANETLVLVFVATRDGVTPVGVSDPPAVATLGFLAAVTKVFPDECHGAERHGAVNGILMGKKLDRVHVQAVALPAGVHHCITTATALCVSSCGLIQKKTKKRHNRIAQRR